MHTSRIKSISFVPLDKLTRVGIARSRIKPSAFASIYGERNDAKNGFIPRLVQIARLSCLHEGLAVAGSESLAKKRDPHVKPSIGEASRIPTPISSQRERASEAA